jgi:hypothetical protein
MVQSRVAEYAACHRICPKCGVLHSLKDRRTKAWRLVERWGGLYAIRSILSAASTL